MSRKQKSDQAFRRRKALQGRVRARMARTGEKYQLAWRRQLEAEAGACDAEETSSETTVKVEGSARSLPLLVRTYVLAQIDESIRSSPLVKTMA